MWRVLDRGKVLSGEYVACLRSSRRSLRLEQAYEGVGEGLQGFESCWEVSPLL